MSTSGNNGTVGDGGLARNAMIDQPRGIAIAADGTLFISVADVTATTDSSPGVRLVSAEGIITTLTGANRATPFCHPDLYCGDGGPALNGQIVSADGLAVIPYGSLIVTDGSRILRVRTPLPGVVVGHSAVPSDDGGALYLFDPSGRHRETRDAELIQSGATAILDIALYVTPMEPQIMRMAPDALRLFSQHGVTIGVSAYPCSD